MTWRILIERPPGYFDPTGETFTGTMAEVNAHIEALQAATGICHAAEAISA
jgi:ribonuclease HI